MHRREYIVASCVGITGLAGCIDSIPFISPGPDKVAKKFYQSTIGGDLEAANGYLHEKSRMAKMTEDDVESLNGQDSTISGVELVVDPEDDDVDIPSILGYTDDGVANEDIPLDPEDVNSGAIAEVSIDYKLGENHGTSTRRLELINDGDGWKIWSY